MVQCSIAPTEKPVPEVKRSQAAPQEHSVKLLIKDHTTSVEEALKLVAPILTILPHFINFMITDPLFLQRTHLSAQEFQLLSSFHFILTNGADLTIEDRLKRVEGELLKLV